MDLRRFEATATALLDSLGDRLPARTRESVGTYLSTGEEGLVADELAGVLRLSQVPVSASERELLRELLYFFDLDDGDDSRARHYRWLYDRDGVLASLNVVAR